MKTAAAFARLDVHPTGMALPSECAAIRPFPARQRRAIGSQAKGLQLAAFSAHHAGGIVACGDFRAWTADPSMAVPVFPRLDRDLTPSRWPLGDQALVALAGLSLLPSGLRLCPLLLKANSVLEGFNAGA